MSAEAKHTWEFRARFRRHAFGWKSAPAIARVRQAVAEIKKVAKKDPVLAAEGAVLFLERLSPAIERVDSSSGSIGTAVSNALEALVPLIASAPADVRTRGAWLERLYEALANDEIPYIEGLGDRWGELCVTKEVASAWADRLLELTRYVLTPGEGHRAHYHGTVPCLDALLRAERHGELIALLAHETMWHYKRWAVMALGAMGRRDEAIALAEASRGSWTNDTDVDRICEELLLADGLIGDAYSRYGLRANRAGTYLATYRAVAKKYPHKPPGELLADLVKTTPGDDGKWFAAAKDAGLYQEALDLAARTPCDPKTLNRAARDHVEKHPAFAVGAGLLALNWLVLGYGYDITSADVHDAYNHTMVAAERIGTADDVRERIRAIVAAESLDRRFVSMVLGRRLGL